MSDFLNSSENLKIMSQNTKWNYCLLKCVTKVTTCASCHKDSKDFLWFISPWSLSSYQLMVSVWPLQITHHIIELQIFDIWSEWNLTQTWEISIKEWHNSDTPIGTDIVYQIAKHYPCAWLYCYPFIFCLDRISLGRKEETWARCKILQVHQWFWFMVKSNHYSVLVSSETHFPWPEIIIPAISFQLSAWLCLQSYLYRLFWSYHHHQG